MTNTNDSTSQMEEAQERLRLIADRDNQLARLRDQAVEINRAQDALSVLETAWCKRLTGECGDLTAAVLKYEGEVIRLALDHAGRSVTKAADSLGVSYQALAYIIDTRQKELLPFRSVKRSRTARVSEDDGERGQCGGCGESWNTAESDAKDKDRYCSNGCERSEA